jgi:hypothetical protein
MSARSLMITGEGAVRHTEYYIFWGMSMDHDWMHTTRLAGLSFLGVLLCMSSGPANA